MDEQGSSSINSGGFSKKSEATAFDPAAVVPWQAITPLQETISSLQQVVNKQSKEIRELEQVNNELSIVKEEIAGLRELAKELPNVKKEVGIARKEVADKVEQQQEKFVAAATIFTALLAFIASETSLLAHAAPPVFLSVSLILIGGILLFANLVLDYVAKTAKARTTSARPTKSLRVISITIIGLGIIFSGWTMRDIAHQIGWWTHDAAHYQWK